MIALSAVQSSAQTVIHDAIFFINTSTVLGRTKVIGELYEAKKCGTFTGPFHIFNIAIIRKTSRLKLHPKSLWILRARDRDRDILARLRFGHQRPVNRGCPTLIGHPRFTGRWCPSRCPRIFSQSVIVYILVFFVWTPAIYWSLVSQSQSRQNISISISP